MSVNIHIRHDDEALQKLPLEPISKLAPFSALIISIIFILLFFIRYYLLEGFLINKLYGKIYTDLSELNRRGFINHHIAGATKMIILIFAIYPFITVASGKAAFRTPYAPGSHVLMGDILIVAAQMLIAMYIFELIYRMKLSPVAVMHHIGTILIGQSAIAISLRLAREPDADIEFVLCTVWGAFDLVSEFCPHVAIILYRVFPTRHFLLSRVFLLSCITTAVGTVVETIVTMYLFGSLWSRWQLAFKVVTPVLHVAFSVTQVHGSMNLFRIYRQQQSILAGRLDPDGEHGGDRGSGRLEVVTEDMRESTCKVVSGGGDERV